MLYSTQGQSIGPPPSAITAANEGACSVTCGVGKQQRLVRFASELCFRAVACAPLDVARPALSSTHSIRLVLPAVARGPGQGYGTRFGVMLPCSIMAGCGRHAWTQFALDSQVSCYEARSGAIVDTAWCNESSRPALEQTPCDGRQTPCESRTVRRWDGHKVGHSHSHGHTHTHVHMHTPILSVSHYCC